MMILTPAVFTDEVMKLFGLVSKTVKQTPMVIDNMYVLVEEVSQQQDYLSRAVRFPLLLLRLVTYLLQYHFHNGSIDHNFDSVRKSFNDLTLLTLHISNCDEYTSILTRIIM